MPNNIAQPKTLDVFMKELLEEQGKKHSLALEKDLLDIHQKATNILGPFSALIYFRTPLIFWLNMIDLFMLINNHNTTYT